MTSTRRFRIFTVLFALCSLLLAQGALAGYVCPGAAKAVQVAQMTEAGMPCAQAMARAMDEEQPVLCHAHCQAADQNADSFHAPVLAGVVQLGAVLWHVAAALTPPDRALLSQAPHLQRSTAPPLAVQHCCFRI